MSLRLLSLADILLAQRILLQATHRFVKFRISAMLSSKSFPERQNCVAGIELIQILEDEQYGFPSASADVMVWTLPSDQSEDVSQIV
jgi:hypothetical protein